MFQPACILLDDVLPLIFSRAATMIGRVLWDGYMMGRVLWNGYYGMVTMGRVLWDGYYGMGTMERVLWAHSVFPTNAMSRAQFKPI